MRRAPGSSRAAGLDPPGESGLNPGVTTLTPPPLIETKLRPPDRREGLVARRRLLERLDHAVGRHPLTLVSASAGWGKSTLLGSWLAGADWAPAWVALDPSDNDPARFWRYVAEALRRAGVRVDDQAPSALAGGGDAREAGLSSMLNAMASDGARAVLALDDYHVITEPGIHDAMAFLVERTPEPVRVVVTTRTDPPLGLARLRARGALGEIRADDLRFDAGEAAELLSGGVGLALDEGEVEQLRARTEGWAAGLYLAALSLRGRPDAATFIREFAGDDRLVVDYLAAEVLEGLPADRREFLLRTSVLSRLTGPLCDAVTGTEASARVLAELEGSNLFLVPLDNRREWYRYHHLFGELLRRELALALPRGEVAGLHRRAAAWHTAEGDADEAVTHLIAADDVDGAAALIAERWAGYQGSGWTATIQRWLGLLPPERVRADARLCMAEALILINLGRPEDAGAWLASAEAAGGDGADRDTLASIAAGRALQACLTGDVPTAVDAGARAVAISEGAGTWWRALACLAHGISLHAAGELEAAAPLLEETVVVGRESGALALVVVALSHLSDTAFQRGDVEGSARRAREAIEAAAQERHAEYPHAAGAHANLARALAVQGDLPAAREEADRGVRLARRGRSPVEIAHSVVVRGEVLALGDDLEGARAAAREARQLLEDARAADNLTEALEALEARAAVPTSPTPAPGPAGAGDLTDRELAVLRRLTGDGSLREIASDLYVSRNTIKTQIRSIYRKLGVATREEAVSAGRRRGLLPGAPTG